MKYGKRDSGGELVSLVLFAFLGSDQGLLWRCLVRI